VGCAASFGGFAAFVWCALVIAIRRGLVRWVVLLRIPAVAVIVFAATNPFVFFSYFAAQGELQNVANWFSPRLDIGSLGQFIWNSLLSGFGFPLVILLAIFGLRELVRPTFSGARLLIAGICLALVLAATLTANLSHWAVNYRYVAYALPCAILFIVAARQPLRKPLLVLALVLTFVQAAPQRLAFQDENNAAHGTRLAAARWINGEIPPGAGVCVGTLTPAPYDTPPFDLTRYDVNAPDCRFLVRVERYDVKYSVPFGFVVAQQFRPRLWVNGFALIFGHINPLVTVYRRV
jgi:hypothetical protein